MNKLSAILAVAMLLFCSQDVRGQGDDASSRETLKGLNEIGVQVLSDSCAGRGYVAAVLNNEAELQLRLAGIKVLPPGAVAHAILLVKLVCVELNGNIKGYTYTQWSEVLQWIEWPFSRPTKLVKVVTWSSLMHLGTESDNNATRVRDAINANIRQFLNAWLAVNR